MNIYGTTKYYLKNEQNPFSLKQFAPTQLNYLSMMMVSLDREVVIPEVLSTYLCDTYVIVAIV